MKKQKIRNADWVTPASAIFDSALVAMASVKTFLDVLGDGDRDATARAYADASPKMGMLHDDFIQWQQSFNGRNVDPRAVERMTYYNNAMARMIGGLLMVFTVSRCIGNPKDESEFEFLLLSAGMGQRVFDGNISLVRDLLTSGVGPVPAELKDTLSLREEHDQMASGFPDVARIAAEHEQARSASGQ